MPGRVRLRWPPGRDDDASLVVAQLRAHSAVHALKVVPAARSVTVGFDASRMFDELVRTLPIAPETRSPPVLDSRTVDWSRVLAAGVLALLPLGPLGNVVVSIVGSVAQQVLQGRRLLPAAVPAVLDPGGRSLAPH